MIKSGKPPIQSADLIQSKKTICKEEKMLTIYDLKKQTMLKAPEFFELTMGYDTLSGVSFVGSLRLLNKSCYRALSRLN